MSLKLSISYEVKIVTKSRKSLGNVPGDSHKIVVLSLLYIWKYLYDQTRKDGTIIPGAITLGLITEEEALKMLEEQKDTEGLLNNEQK